MGKEQHGLFWQRLTEAATAVHMFSLVDKLSICYCVTDVLLLVKCEVGEGKNKKGSCQAGEMACFAAVSSDCS